MAAGVSTNRRRRSRKPSSRQLDILRCVALGQTNPEIAATFGLSVETVKMHLKHAFKKSGTGDRTRLVLWALAHGMLTVALDAAGAVEVRIGAAAPV